MRKTIEQVTCDECGKDLTYLSRDLAHLKRTGIDLCKDCLLNAREDIELEYRRLFNNEVPDRRGGWRQLGEYDG